MMSPEGFSTGDIIECYEMVEKARD